MEIDRKLVNLAERMSDNIDKQSDVIEKALESNNRLFRWFCTTLIVITLIFCTVMCVNTYNRESCDYKIENRG